MRIKNYKEVFLYLCEHYNWVCPIWEAKSSKKEKELVYSGKKRPPAIGQLHHIAHNSKMNRKRWPLLIDHVWNLLPVSPEWHMAYHDFGRRSDIENEKREQFLRSHPMLVKWAKEI